MNIWSDNMFFLASQFNEFLIIAIVAVLVIAIGLLVYYIVEDNLFDNIRQVVCIV